MESEDNFEFFEGQPFDFEVHNQNVVEMVGISVVEQTFSSLDEIDRFISLYTSEKQLLDVEVQHNQNFVEMADIPVVEQSIDEIDRFISSYEGNSEILEEQPLDVEVHNQNSVEMVNAPVVGQLFSNWDEIDRKRTGCRWQVRATCPKKTDILSISSLCLSHNDHPLTDETNKFASKHRAFSEEMLKDIRFWTEIDLSNAIRSFKRQNHTECEAAILLNQLLERKADDTRWMGSLLSSRILTAEMQSTQRVEGQNSIIKSSVNSSTSLINLAKHIDEQIDRASTLIQYRNWTHSITGFTLIHASSEFPSNIDKWIVTYLTPTSLSMQRQEISQVVWYMSRLINNFQDLGLQLDLAEQQFSEHSNLIKPDAIDIHNFFAKDVVDTFTILIKELISSAEVISILEIWEVS
ncbi:9107_t:CDS:2 [Gigaspora rosea]|nr:9107_t:CDS:2 [Gigaspora rosea]